MPSTVRSHRQSTGNACCLICGARKTTPSSQVGCDVISSVKYRRPVWQRLTVLAGMVLATVLGTVAVPMTAVAAPSLDVFVGYADTLRANPTQFPTPWDGAPDVIFAGCHVNCSFDAGAAPFVNNSGVSLTIDFVHIRLSTCTFDMWPHGQQLNDGQQFIVTQTASGAADGCDNSAGFFDTSDIGPNGTGWAGRCDQSGVIPQIDVSINGVVSTFTDAGQA